MSTTIYNSSSSGPQIIREMPYPHLKAAAAKLERDKARNPDTFERQDELEALRETLQERYDSSRDVGSPDYMGEG